MNINGMTDKLQVLTAIKESIQDGNNDLAIDMINQLIDHDTPKPETVADARDHHLINQNFKKMVGK